MSRDEDAAAVIRPLARADVEAAARLIASDPLWRRYGVTVGQARAALEGALRRRLGPSEGRIAVARRSGRVVGFVWFRTEGTFHHSGYVRWVAVAPHVRGLGIGRRLLEYAEAEIFQRGPNVFLLVSDFNRRAQAFYRRQGYTKVGAIPDYVVPGITEYVFRKTRGPIARPGVAGRVDARRCAGAKEEGE